MFEVWANWERRCVCVMLFRGAELKPSAPDSPAPPPANEGTFDPVLDELKRWEGMGLKEYSHFMTADGLLNEVKMIWALRESFPLHFIVFKQTACHLPHEANVEADLLASRATRRSKSGPCISCHPGEGGLQQEGAHSIHCSGQGHEVLRNVSWEEGCR